MSKTRGAVAAIAAAGLGLLAVQPLAASAAVLPQRVASAGAPKLTIPTATVPSVTVPSVSTPVVTTPPVTTPKLTTPTVTTPPAPRPTVTVPSVTTPRVTTPVATVPSATTPAVSPPSSGSPPSGRQGTSGSVGTTVSKVAEGLGATTRSGAGTPGRAVSSTSTTSGAAGSPEASRAPGASSVTSVFATSGTPSSGETPDAARAAHGGAARPGSPRARRRAAARENRRLRRLVARLGGCLATLDGRAQRLLGLRAGLHGQARSAAATARILRISPRREARLERRAVTTLQGRTGASCAGSASTPASTPVSSSEITAASSLSSAPRAQPGTSGASATLTGAHASGGDRHAGGRSGGSVNIAPSGERTERADADTSFPSAIVTALLGLLLAIALVAVPKLRRRPAAAGPGVAGVPGAPDEGARKPPRVAPAPKRRFTRMDPSIAPMAAQVFDQMAGEEERASDQPHPDERGPDDGQDDGPDDGQDDGQDDDAARS